MEKIFLILNILLLLKRTKAENEKCIYSFHCENENKNNICLKKLKTDSDDIYDILLNPYSNHTCDVHNSLIGDREKIIKYNENNSNLKKPSYPNGTCFNDLDCLTGICKNSLCINYKICSSHENCPLGTFCFNGECKKYLEDEERCSESYQCKYNSFCNKKDNICRKLFYFEDGTDITEIINKNENENLNFGEICKSGGYIKIKEKPNSETKYFCETLYNYDISCKNKCTYKRKTNNQNIIIEDKCLCGYNKLRKKYCELGNGEQEFIEYLKMRKDFLFNEDYIKKCHTLERDSNEICNELINTNETVTFREYAQKYKNLKINALEYHRIKGADNCIKEVVFGYDTNPVIPIKQSCPKFTCDNNIEKCLYGINQFNEEGNNITIKINNNICTSNEQCTINKGILASNDLMDIMKKKNIEGKCSIYFYWPGLRYPGEQCNIDSDCIDDNRCENGKCSGIEGGKECNTTSQCKVGYYCNKVCTLQKAEGERCTEGWDCQNFLGCYKGRCIKFGILKPLVQNTQSNAPFPGDEKRYYLCSTGELDGDDGTTGDYCVKTKYSDNWIKNNNKTIDRNGFIKCDYKENCLYDNGKKTIKKICGCGYNSDGQGYCPLPSSLRIEEWNKRIQFFADFANNNCHTLSRFNCYSQNTLENYNMKKYYDKKTVEAHLFYKAVPCAEKMFSFGNYLIYNFFFLFLFFSIL